MPVELLPKINIMEWVVSGTIDAELCNSSSLLFLLYSFLFCLSGLSLLRLVSLPPINENLNKMFMSIIYNTLTFFLCVRGFDFCPAFYGMSLHLYLCYLYHVRIVSRDEMNAKPVLCCNHRPRGEI